MPKRVLLTGAGGFVGSHTLRHLLVNTDWEIVVLDSFRHKGTTDRVATQLDGQDKSRVHVFVHDLRVPISSILARKIGRLDYIISMASESHVDRSIAEPRDFIENNVQLMLTLLEYAREYPVGKFLQVSTDEVYGPAPNGHNHVEWETYLPSNPYSASKAAQESICFAYWRTYGIPLIITNTMNIIGELQDAEKFVPMVMQKVAKGEPMTIHASKTGEIGSRFYLHARNQADALLYLLTHVEPVRYGDSDKPDKFHIVGEREIDNLQMAQLVAQYMGKPLKYELVDFHSSRPGHDLRYALDGSKLAVLGWKAPFSLEESLQRTVEWTLNNKEYLQ
jgi:dTDP-glucose 4,6-dehydratase